MIKSIKSNWQEIKMFGLHSWFLDSFIPYHWRFWWSNNIFPYYAPQHNELRAAIPKTWSDLDVCINNFLRACVISYVEKENGIQHWEAQESGHFCKNNVEKLKEVYQWAKIDYENEQKNYIQMLPVWNEDEDLVDWMNRENSSRDKQYNLARKYEKQIKKKEQEYLIWIVKSKDYMWS